LKLNTANYTIWYFRRLVLKHLNSNLHDELEFISNLGDENPKNYQIWYHRKWIIEQIKDFSKELDFTASQIKDDNKNYHAWAHRQWVIETTGSWDSEILYIDSLLKLDLRNNSAWNQRYFVISRNNKVKFSKEIIQNELQFALSYIKKAPNNQSPWVYLKGLFIHEKFSDFPEFLNTMEEIREKYITSSHATSLLIDIYEQKNTKESLQKALKLTIELANQLDTIHNKYWVYKRGRIEELINLA